MKDKLPKDIAPEWFTECFFEKALQSGLKNSKLKVTGFDCEIATSEGENYCSKVVRVNVSFKKNNESECKRTSFIVKLPTRSLKKLFAIWNMFEKEGETLHILLPQIHSILKRSNEQQKPFWPICYYTESSPEQSLIIEDLRPSGYTVANRYKGLDIDHCKLVLTSLAKLHAASLVLSEEKPEVFENFKPYFYSKKLSILLENFMKPVFKKYSEIILEWMEIEKRASYSEKLRKFGEKIVEQVTEAWERDDSKVNVLLHGDIWINNVMFKYLPSGKVSDVKFIDFQLVSLNSPVMDLYNFIFTSTAPEIMFNKMDTLLQIYHQAFVSTLNELNHSISYTFDELKEDFDRKCKWGLVYFVVHFPTLVQSSSSATAEEFFNESKMEAFVGNLNQDTIRQLFKVGLPFFDSKGVL